MRGLYAIVDPEHCRGRDPVWITERILLGGACALQLRSKKLADGPCLALAAQMRSLCRRAGVPFWMNDRVDVALLVEADGVHLGQDDLPLAAARKLFSGQLGLSTHSLTQLHAALTSGADVVGFGPVFGTSSKENPDPIVGLDGLAAAVAQSVRPVIAIGGVKLDALDAIRATGARCAAVISAVCGADDPAEAARAFHTGLCSP